jgi:hypothetical protein
MADIGDTAKLGDMKGSMLAYFLLVSRKETLPNDAWSN